MTTLAELRLSVRAELGDLSATPLWPDERLDAWVRDAIRAYGEALPRAATLELITLQGEPRYPLPADLLSVLAVDDAAGWPVPRSADADAPGYEPAGGQLIVRPTPRVSGQTITLRYLGLYAAPAADSDPLATPPRDDDLLRLAVAASALRWLWTAEAKALRYVGRTGAPTGVVALERANGYQQAFERLLAERRGRRASLRVGRLSARGP